MKRDGFAIIVTFRVRELDLLSLSLDSLFFPPSVERKGEEGGKGGGFVDAAVLTP